jgi:hypothetical protein
MDPAFRLHPGQESLTPAQEAEARRFADGFIRRQLAAEPVDEQEAEAWLCQAYQAARLAPPQRIHWLDGPFQLGAVLPSDVGNLVLDDVESSLGADVRANLRASLRASVRASVWNPVWDCLRASLRNHVKDHIGDQIGSRVWASLRVNVSDPIRANVSGNVWNHLVEPLWYVPQFQHSIIAYRNASWLAYSNYFAVYLAPYDLAALARFNELVSGYWLGNEAALIVRRPRVLSRDAEGRLHSATGRCIEYRDGFGFYAWHGMQVPERVILAPEQLSREDFVAERNAEMRRVIQERMGEQFMTKVGGEIIDSGPRGTLYEVLLSHPVSPWERPELVVRYVRVQDASTPRQYYLRVPPTIQTAAEAVAWSFGLSVEDYGPAQQT